ncbi:lysozyme inhibitor LprI family protein [Herbaspirillum rubrisubalbicans]|uniref:lysozyme inhibitor LprI family protein n=1 Tax=Herbaspirillum rubrisubalbicans TaxID=80842 RepID=UPI000DD44962|nr:lysozyme inhibitor LprI family protein [Herbaspirillum rubrisubalbicans]
MKKTISTFILFSLSALHAQAFDCTKASNFAETEICKDHLLSALDMTLNRNYRVMMASDIGTVARKNLSASQRLWLQERSRCKDKECITTLYKRRLADICDYPVIAGAHPVCDEFDDVVENDLQRHDGEKR